MAALLLTLAAAAAVLTALAIRALRPVLHRYALARPNARSSHSAPTPQGGGIAVVGVTILATGAALQLVPGLGEGLGREVPAVLAAALGLALLGAADDIRALPAAPKLLVQALAVGLVVAALPAEARVLPDVVPPMVERGLALVAGLWFVNLVNFMDGLDWMTVAEAVPVTAALGLVALGGGLPPAAGVVAGALLGAVLGFAPFNRPVARLFLGDVGSLALGLLLGWLLWRLAAHSWAAALLLPLYYLADATLTLLRRLWRRERVWEAHRTHFYQQATARGLTVPAVVARVFGLNLALAALALATIARPALSLPALALGAAAVALLLRRFARGDPGAG